MTRTITSVRFPRGIPAFDGVEQGELVRGTGNILSLRVGDGRLPVVVPWDANPDFGYRFCADDVEDLGDPTDWTILCVVSLPRRHRLATINQFAPIVVNERLGIAAQLINQVGGYSTRDPLGAMA